MKRKDFFVNNGNWINMKKKENTWKNATFNRIMGIVFIHVLWIFFFIIIFIYFSSRQLLRQHKAKLHKRAKEIQEQLVR